MKKSEMVRYLVASINHYDYIDETAAEELLEGLQHLGMLPPAYTCINESNKTPTPLGSCKLHEREPEDEI